MYLPQRYTRQFAIVDRGNVIMKVVMHKKEKRKSVSRIFANSELMKFELMKFCYNLIVLTNFS
jgi:hypothetical protein